jgi:uncharacterized protein
MKSTGKRVGMFALAGILLITLTVVVQTAAAAEVQRYVMGGGPMGGPWKIGVGAGVQMINEQLKDKYFVTAAASGGSVENMRRMFSGEYQTAWAHIHNMFDAWNGVGLFQGQKPLKNMRVLEKITDQAVCVVVSSKSPIHSYMDLVGKRVSAGPAGSGNVIIAEDIFKALGLTGKVKMTYLSFESAAQALKDGQLDVSLSGGGPYVLPAITEISRSISIRIVEPGPEEMKKIDAAVPYLTLGAIPPNKAPGENADKERKAFFYSTYWIALAGMTDEAAYDFLKLTQDPMNKELLGKIMSFWTTAGPDFGPIAKGGIPLHPGAAKFWSEKGVKVPPAIGK